MNTTTLISSLSGVAAAAVAGWFAWLAKKAQSYAPESVAGGYSKLIGDMRMQYEELMFRIEQLEAEKEAQDHQISALTRQVNWLIDHVPPERRLEFRDRFAGPKDQH